MLHLIIAESSLELVPAEIVKEPDVVKSAKRRNKPASEILLDVSLHYNAMRKLKRREKRGRPDIVHQALLSALETPLVHIDMLKVYVHTIDDKVIYMKPDLRLPKNYNRFVGLVEQLLTVGRVPPDSSEPLMWVEEISLKELLSLEIRPSKTYIFTERGKLVRLNHLSKEIVKLLKGKLEVAVLIGGFPHGDFEEETLRLGEKISIYGGRSLKTWHIVCRLLALIEDQLGVI